jgi:hypothetical protein
MERVLYEQYVRCGTGGRFVDEADTDCDTMSNVPEKSGANIT